MVNSRAYPDLDRSPKKNWVEKAGGLPDYIERIAKHIHYEGGKEIGTAISMAISQVRKWAAGGEGVSAKTQALASKAIAAWEALKAKSKAKTAVQMSARRIRAEVIELSIVEDKTGRPPTPMRVRTNSAAKPPKAVKPKQIRRVKKKRKKITQLSRGGRGPYRRHVAHTKQFGRTKGDLSKPASWQHPYVPRNQVAGAIKAKHIQRADVDDSGHPRRGKSDDVKKPLPASAAIGGEGRKEQRTGAEAKSTPKRAVSAKKPPIEAKTTTKDRRNVLERKRTAGTITPTERRELNSLVTKLKKPS
jgi:hypothetical protein